MKYQPTSDYVSNDVVMTPEHLCKNLITHFKPQGKGLEPCRGTGNFYRNLGDNCDWCELSEGRNFFEYNKHVDYIFTNPPYSKMRDFLIHSYEIADNIYFLISVNHVFTKARIRDMRQYGFGIKEICMMNDIEGFPQSGFQYGMVHYQKDYVGDTKLSYLDDDFENLFSDLD